MKAKIISIFLLGAMFCIYGFKGVTSQSGASLQKQACKLNCFTPYGEVLGSNHGVDAYSNCNNTCISGEESYFEEFYSGIKGQCVEYARRWLESVKHVKFGGVESAFEIWDLSTATALYDSEVTYPFESCLNGGERPPEIGDLLIYPYAMPDFPYGHVAVIVDVNMSVGYVDIAEQNYSNESWIDPHSYARRLKLKVKGGSYHILDEDFEAHHKRSISGAIVGWKKVRIPSSH